MAVRPTVNPSFEDGALTGWTFTPAGTASISVKDNTTVGSGERTPYGTKFARMEGGTGVVTLIENQKHPVSEGKVITSSCNFSQGPAGWNQNTGCATLIWYDAGGGTIAISRGNLITGTTTGTRFALTTVTATAPAGAATVSKGLEHNRTRAGDWSDVDNFVWDYEAPSTDAVVTSPTGAVNYAVGDVVPFRSSYTSPASVASMVYEVTDVTSATLVATLTPDTNAAPWAVNYSELGSGPHTVVAKFLLTTGETITSAAVAFTIGPPVPPITREYRASNSGTYLVMGGFSGIASTIPSTALVVGAELVCEYGLQILSRTLDTGITAEDSNPDTVFNIITGGNLEAVLLDQEGTQYSTVGTAITSTVDINRSDFTVTEEGTSEGMKWVVFNSNTNYTTTLGSEDSLFGSRVLTPTELLANFVGLKVTPVLGSIPALNEKGDASLRIRLNSVKMRVYFDAGSVDYYFASPDKAEVVRGRLVAANVLNGDLRNGDASGVLQLSPELEVVLGTSGETILEDWTIHSNEAVSDDNQIGVVFDDMKYNSLANSIIVQRARTRYEFITANFYGDERLNSIYGVNGVGRAFSYNGEEFYKIYTQEEASKDLPRHLAYHHAHLALGYQEGRVDISVVGEPYNFDGALGASSWGIGDGVTGLLQLSGTILGVFGSNSVTGISGTTVDNFATQVISPKMGAIEYTITDMGYPVYANSYGIYTLSQVQQYGDFLGSPLSQDISPWLRPRLVRKETSATEVITSWAVRSKNQYRLAFSDGYVLTMTMNNGQQSAPTFSTQQYLVPYTVATDPEDQTIYGGEAIVPAAISSQLDEGGEERIHIANRQVVIT